MEQRELKKEKNMQMYALGDAACGDHSGVCLDDDRAIITWKKKSTKTLKIDNSWCVTRPQKNGQRMHHLILPLLPI